MIVGKRNDPVIFARAESVVRDGAETISESHVLRAETRLLLNEVIRKQKNSIGCDYEHHRTA